MTEEREALFHIPADLDAAILSVRARGACIYFVRTKSARRIKIGFANELMNRLCALATACPETVELLAVMHGTHKDEKYLHRRFTNWRARGEWFEEAPGLLSFIEHLRTHGDDGWKGWLESSGLDRTSAPVAEIVRLWDHRG